MQSMIKTQPSPEAQSVAEQALVAWPGCHLRHCPELSTHDVTVFLLISRTGRNCGSIAVTAGGSVIARGETHGAGAE